MCMLLPCVVKDFRGDSDMVCINLQEHFLIRIPL